MIWIAVVVGALLVLIGCPILIKTWLKQKDYAPVVATCKECQISCGKTNKKYTPIFEYCYNGKAYVSKSARMTKELQEGYTYACCCDSENPECVMLLRAKHEPLFMAIGCVLVLALGIILVLLQEGIWTVS